MPPRHTSHRRGNAWHMTPIIGAVAHGITNLLAPPYYHDNREYHHHDYYNGLHDYRSCRRCYHHSRYCPRCRQRGYYAHVYSEVDNFLSVGDLVSSGLVKLIVEDQFGKSTGKIGTSKSDMGLAYPFAKYESNLVKLAGNDIINTNTKFRVEIIVTAFTDANGDGKTNNYWELYSATSDNVEVDLKNDPVYYESSGWSVGNDDIMGVKLNFAMAKPTIKVDTTRKDKIVALHVRTTVREMIEWVKLDTPAPATKPTFRIVNYPKPTQIITAKPTRVPSAVAFDSSPESSVVRVYANRLQYSIKTTEMTGVGYLYNRPIVGDTSIAEQVASAINQVDTELIANISNAPAKIKTTLAQLTEAKRADVAKEAKTVETFAAKYELFKKATNGKLLIMPTTNYTFNPVLRSVSNPEVFLLFAPALKKGQDNKWFTTFGF